MGDPAPVVGGGGELQPQELLLGIDVPQAEIDGQPAALDRDLAVQQSLGVDGLPVREARLDVDVQGLFDEGALRDRREQARALEVAGDDLGDLGALGAAERRDGDGQRLDVAAVDVDLDLGAGGR